MDVKAFLKAVLRQQRQELFSYFAPDAVIRWHCSNEQFTVDEYIKANCDYPGDWNGDIERITPIESGYAVAMRVYPPDQSASFHVVSFIIIENDHIVSMDEYWADDGEAPEWRKKLNIGKPIH